MMMATEAQVTKALDRLWENALRRLYPSDNIGEPQLPRVRTVTHPSISRFREFVRRDFETHSTIIRVIGALDSMRGVTFRTKRHLQDAITTLWLYPVAVASLPDEGWLYSTGVPPAKVDSLFETEYWERFLKHPADVRSALIDDYIVIVLKVDGNWDQEPHMLRDYHFDTHHLRENLSTETEQQSEIQRKQAKRDERKRKQRLFERLS